MVDSPVSPSCDVCFKQELMLFKCKYCGGSFCAEHRLPENHACVGGYNTGGTWFGFRKADDKVSTSRTVISVGSKSGRFASYKVKRWLRSAASYLFVGCYVLFFSLPVGVAIFVSANLDPFTKLFLRSLVDQIYLYALGYVACAGYLLYLKVNRREVFKAYVLVAAVSFVSTWLLMDKAAVLYALNTMLGGGAKTLPNILELYLLWVYVLLDKGLSSISPLAQSYPPGRTFINNLRYWIAERARRIF